MATANAAPHFDVRQKTMKYPAIAVLFVAIQVAASGQHVESAAEDDTTKVDKACWMACGP